MTLRWRAFGILEPLFHSSFFVRLLNIWESKYYGFCSLCTDFYIVKYRNIGGRVTNFCAVGTLVDRCSSCIAGSSDLIWRALLAYPSQRNQLDHILGPGSDVRAFTTTYLNFISDHFAITLRIPLLGADFIDDDRLKKQSDQRECLFQEPAPPTPKRIKKPLPGTPTKKKKGTRQE